MDSDSRPLRLVKFWIRKGTTGVCLEIKDTFISIHPLGPFPDPDLTNAVTFHSTVIVMLINYTFIVLLLCTRLFIFFPRLHMIMYMHSVYSLFVSLYIFIRRYQVISVLEILYNIPMPNIIH